MKLFKILLIAGTLSIVFSSAATAGDFGWTNVFDFEAYTNPSELRTKLVSRFNIDDAELNAILSYFNSPSDAYIILRLGEMSGRPTGYVVEKYRNNNSTGWDGVALSLGIKTGSEKFNVLKRGHDLQDIDNFHQVVDAGSDSPSSQ
jgi:hypothetical protein